jgi:hypothetical protein
MKLSEQKVQTMNIHKKIGNINNNLLNNYDSLNFNFKNMKNKIQHYRRDSGLSTSTKNSDMNTPNSLSIISTYNSNSSFKNSTTSVNNKENNNKNDVKKNSNRNIMDLDLNVNYISNNQLIQSISNIMEDIIDPEIDEPKKTSFDNKIIPGISINYYIKRILKYCLINHSTAVFCLILIDRIPEEFLVSRFNIHKIILASMLIASKINEDKIHTNAYFSRVGGINLFEMNTLEIDLLNLIQFNLFVNEGTYRQYDSHVLRNLRKIVEKTIKIAA